MKITLSIITIGVIMAGAGALAATPASTSPDLKVKPVVTQSTLKVEPVVTQTTLKVEPVINPLTQTTYNPQK